MRFSVERQQLLQGIVVGNIGRPAVGSGNSGIESRVHVREPLRTIIVEVRQRALLERLERIPIAGIGRFG